MRCRSRDVSPPKVASMKGPEGPVRNSKQPQNESEADYHSRGVTGNGGGGNGGRKTTKLKTMLNRFEFAISPCRTTLELVDARCLVKLWSLSVAPLYDG